MDLLDYITYDEIRTTVGLSSDELPDATLALELYTNALEIGLDSVDMSASTVGTGTLISRFNTVSAMSDTSRTTDQQKLYNYTRMYSAYTVGLEVAISLSMRAPKDISDSKVTLTRFSPENTWRDVVNELKDKVATVKTLLESIAAPVIEAPLYFKAVKPLYDPVTGE
jgi:hypothetical protein